MDDDFFEELKRSGKITPYSRSDKSDSSRYLNEIRKESGTEDDRMFFEELKRSGKVTPYNGSDSSNNRKSGRPAKYAGSSSHENGRSATSNSLGGEKSFIEPPISIKIVLTVTLPLGTILLLASHFFIDRSVSPSNVQPPNNQEVQHDN